MLGILVIHGIFGSPLEFTPLTESLVERGFTTHSVTLPGHGPRASLSLRDVTSERLIEHCRQEYQILSRQAEHIIIIGHSLGGICSLITAGSSPEKLAGVIALATPYEHAFTVNHQLGWLDVPIPHLLRGLQYVPDQWNNADQLPPGFTQTAPFAFPHLVTQSEKLLRELQYRLPEINVPVMMAHSPYDLTIPYSEMKKIADNLHQSPRIITHTLEKSGHQFFPRSGDSVRLSQHIHEFLDQIILETRKKAPYAQSHSK